MRCNAAILACLLAAAWLPGVSGARRRLVRRLAGRTLLESEKDAVTEQKPIKGGAWTKPSKPGTEEGFIGNLKCGDTVKVSSKDSKDERCPSSCPYFAQDKGDEDFCTFTCVKDSDACIASNPKTLIPDKDRGICRAPMVQACREYATDGTDSCKVCQSLYRLGKDGQCHSIFRYAIYGLGMVLLLVVVFLIVWILDMLVRPITNREALDAAVEFRSLQKLRTRKDEGRRVWPLSTNLLREEVAGAGMLNHFNFQFMVIIWAVVVACGWMVLAATVDPALWILGTRKFGTPRDNCILVAWGYEKQQGLMWTKVLFLVCVYLFSFFGSLLHGVRQLRMFQLHDLHNKTMKDFSGLLSGLPQLSGSERVEEELKDRIADATGTKVIGVSVCWDYKEHEESFTKFLEKDMVKRGQEKQSARSTPRVVQESQDTQVEMGMVRKQLFGLEKMLFSPEEEAEEDLDASGQDLKEKLLGLQTSPYAFVVFDTEDDRDRACQSVTDSALDFRGSLLHLEQQGSEPDTVEWHQFGHSTLGAKLWRLFKGIGAICLALLFWTVVFYAPYAWSIFSFNYDNGQEPGAIYSISFSMVVVIGNQIMYEVCAQVSDNVGFRFKDNKAGCYMILFTVACLYNVLVDMVTTYFMAETIMTELGFRSYFGTKLSKIEHFTERFETYAMQRTLAENVYLYAFPSTYLIPFLLEPIFTIGVPLMLGILIVRSHPEIRGSDAEGWIGAIPMDMGRYADIILNCVLGILIFYFPGGYTHWLFLGLAGSHIYVYYMDHYKVLRSVPSLTIATMDVDWWSQAMMAPCCALMASCLVFKGNCQDYGYCLEGLWLISACTLAFILHCIVHLLLLVYIVPHYGISPPDKDPCEGVTFKDVAEKQPCSWFNVNPVFCLRSLLFYQHQTPCRFWFTGKEHLLQYNPEIGCYFTDKAAKAEDFSTFARFGTTS